MGRILFVLVKWKESFCATQKCIDGRKEIVDFSHQGTRISHVIKESTCDPNMFVAAAAEFSKLRCGWKSSETKAFQ